MWRGKCLWDSKVLACLLSVDLLNLNYNILRGISIQFREDSYLVCKVELKTIWLIIWLNDLWWWKFQLTCTVFTMKNDSKFDSKNIEWSVNT